MKLKALMRLLTFNSNDCKAIPVLTRLNSHRIKVNKKIPNLNIHVRYAVTAQTLCLENELKNLNVVRNSVLTLL